MNTVNIVKLATITIISTISLILMQIFYVLNSIPLDLINYYFKGLTLIFVIDCHIVSTSYRNKSLNYGYFFIISALLLDFLNLIIINTNLRNSVMLVVYYLFIITGIFLIINGKNRNLKRMNELNNELLSLAYLNPITSLYNRNYINHMKETIFKKTQFAVLFIDIDDFKMINDYLGHANGDRILKMIGYRLKSAISHDDIIFHLSGDEFLVIIENVAEIGLITGNIIKMINEPYTINNKNIMVSSSIGIAIYPQHGNTLEKLIKKADIAMYEAKKEGKNNYRIFNEKSEEEFDNRQNFINELKNAIKINEFVVYYQAKAYTQNNQITGLEALVRWNHPKHGIISPNNFIPLAEEIGVIHKIDIIVLKTVCKQIRNWINEGKTPYNISVNISPQFFSNENFIPTLDNILAEYGIDTEYLGLEITENIALQDINKSKEIFYELKSRKIKIYIDDFGKGYSSLTYIKEFAFDFLKIDKAFIDGIPDSTVDKEIIEMIIKLSKVYGFMIIYEGVEYPEQLNFLRELGAYEYQGYLLSKPQPIEKIGI